MQENRGKVLEKVTGKGENVYKCAKNIRTILSAIALFRIQYSVIQFFFKPLHG